MGQIAERAATVATRLNTRDCFAGAESAYACIRTIVVPRMLLEIAPNARHRLVDVANDLLVLSPFCWVEHRLCGMTSS
jgi:hypothetical protein